jgi:hypothetical protein
MAHKLRSKTSPLTTVFIIVIVLLLVLSLLGKKFTASNPQTEMRAEVQNPLPTQTLNQGGQKSTVLSFTPASSASQPLSAKVGDTIPLEIQIDPGQNLVSFVKVAITYDPRKLTPVKPQAVIPDEAMSAILDGPLYTKGKISVTMSVGADPTRALSKPTTAATVTFKAIASTKDSEPTEVTFGPETNILSLAANDSASENVLSSITPEVITISR